MHLLLEAENSPLLIWFFLSMAILFYCILTTDYWFRGFFACRLKRVRDEWVLEMVRWIIWSSYKYTESFYNSSQEWEVSNNHFQAAKSSITESMLR